MQKLILSNLYQAQIFSFIILNKIKRKFHNLIILQITYFFKKKKKKILIYNYYSIY